VCAIVFLKPWRRVTDEQAMFFEGELKRVLAPHHPLFGRHLAAAAVTCETDDVLFQLDEGVLAQVHLTYALHPEAPGFPYCQMFSTFGDWMLEAMLSDHLDRLPYSER
jgi:hypothetical protein